MAVAVAVSVDDSILLKRWELGRKQSGSWFDGRSDRRGGSFCMKSYIELT
jgi:hypothetical protein